MHVVDVLACGRPSVDLTFLGLPCLPRLGEEYHVGGFAMNPGAGFITVNAMRRLGLRTGYATDLGSDMFSRYILESLRALGIDETFIVHHDRDLSNITVGLSFPEDRSFITWEADEHFAGRGVLPQDLQDHHVRCLFSSCPVSPEVLDEARRQHIPICSDTSCDREYLESERARVVLRQASVFLPNSVEACTITGKADPEQALLALMDCVETVVVKLGPQGAIGGRAGCICHVPALPVDVVDTTGAGDNFDAGFVYGLLHDLSLEQCLRCGAAAGSLSTRFVGGIKGSPSEAELFEAVARLEDLSASYS